MEWATLEGKLLNPGATLFWSEHSTRAVLPSWGAALGYGGEELDYVGRWSPQGSDAYVRTNRAVVLRLHQEIAVKIRQAACKGDCLGEGHLAERLDMHLVACGWPAGRAQDYSLSLCTFDVTAPQDVSFETPITFAGPVDQGFKVDEAEDDDMAFSFPFIVLTSR